MRDVQYRIFILSAPYEKLPLVFIEGKRENRNGPSLLHLCSFLGESSICFIKFTAD